MKRMVIAISLLIASTFFAGILFISEAIALHSTDLLIVYRKFFRYLPTTELLIPFIISVIFIGISLIMLFIEYFRSFKEK